MLHSGILFDAVALPYDLLTRHPIWERHCAQMAAALPAGAQRILDLGCGPGNSTAHLGPGAWGGLFAGDAAQEANTQTPRELSRSVNSWRPSPGRRRMVRTAQRRR